MKWEGEVGGQRPKGLLQLVAAFCAAKMTELPPGLHACTRGFFGFVAGAGIGREDQAQRES